MPREAIENNNIGAVAVQEKGHVAGIVPEWDLTIRVVGIAAGEADGQPSLYRSQCTVRNGYG
ncbi:hypothetical protein [Nitrospira sp. Nam74]